MNETLSDTHIEEVTLQRGACYGACPIYEVTLRRDGSAAWLGEAFTPRTGEYAGRIRTYEFARLADFIERCRFFDWKDEYSEPVTDNPTFVLQVSRGRKVKRVRQYATDEPPDFWVVAELVDALANDIEWTPSTRT